MFEFTLTVAARYTGHSSIDRCTIVLEDTIAVPSLQIAYCPAAGRVAVQPTNTWIPPFVKSMAAMSNVGSGPFPSCWPLLRTTVSVAPSFPW